MAEPRAATRVAGVVGWPVDHSLSPTIHNTAYRELRLDWVYVAFSVLPERLGHAILGLRALGVAGVNVTMPHQEEAARLATARSDDVELLNAANVLTFEDDDVVADNTDVGGFAAFLERDAGFEPAGRRGLVYGAGGAARACALALARGGLAHLTVAVRVAERASALVEMLEGTRTEVSVAPFAGDLVPEADVVVNATPLGGGEEAFVPARFAPGQLVVDLLYRPAVTPLVAAARAAGAQAFGGLGMLLHQAALTIERWTGHVAPLAEMSAAALAELTEDPMAGFVAP